VYTARDQCGIHRNPSQSKVWEHICGVQSSTFFAVFAMIFFERFADIFKGELADTETDRNVDGGLGVVADLHGPAANVANIADASTAADREARNGRRCCANTFSPNSRYGHR